MYTPVNPSFTILKWDVRGYSLHDGECEIKKRLNFCKQYKIFTAFWDFIPKCRSWWIVDAVKDKIKKKKDQNKNQKKKKKKIVTKWDSNHDRLRGKQGSYPLDYSIIWLLNRSVKYLCKFLYIVWETRS